MKIMALHETMFRGLQAGDPNSGTGLAGLKPAAHALEGPILEVAQGSA